MLRLLLSPGLDILVNPTHDLPLHMRLIFVLLRPFCSLFFPIVTLGTEYSKAGLEVLFSVSVLLLGFLYLLMTFKLEDFLTHP